MAEQKKMTGAERKQAIVEAARPLFAQNGFRGTFVKDIAEAANVSEALLYKHFTSKEEIYNEMMDYTAKMTTRVPQKLLNLEFGTEALVVTIYFLVRAIMFEIPDLREDQRWHEKLLYRSLIGDTRYAKSHLNRIRRLVEEPLRNCIAAASEAGDVEGTSIEDLNSLWLVHHLGMAINLCHLSDEPVFEYVGSKKDFFENAVLFCMRGVGMTESAISRYYNPDKLSQFFEEIYL